MMTGDAAARVSFLFSPRDAMMMPGDQL